MTTKKDGIPNAFRLNLRPRGLGERPARSLAGRAFVFMFRQGSIHEVLGYYDGVEDPDRRG